MQMQVARKFLFFKFNNDSKLALHITTDKQLCQSFDKVELWWYLYNNFIFH